MSKKFLSVALVGSMAMASGATVMAAETEVVTAKEALDSGMVKRTAGGTLVIDKSMTIDLSGIDLTAKGITAIEITGGEEVRIISSASQSTIDSDKIAIKISGSNTNVVFDNVYIKTSEANSSAVKIDGGANIVFNNVHIESSDVSSSNVTISGGANVKFKNVTFKVAENSTESPVKVLNGGANITVSGTIESINLKDNGYVISNNETGGKVTLKIEDGSTSSNGNEKYKVSPSNVGNLINESKGNVEIVDKPSGGGSTGGGSTGGGGSISKPEYTHTQIIGKDRYETAAKLADKLGNYDTVILVNSDKTMADGLSAASLAGKLNAPILPVKQNKIPDSVMQRIEKAKNVYIIGGTEAISKDVENKLLDKKITRIGGETRFETSEKISAMIGNYSEAYIVNGVTCEADAMSISPVAAKKIAPIIVTDGKKSDYKKKSGTDYTVIGGEKAVTKELASKYSAERISGTNRYETNRAVMDKFYSGADTVYLANGETLVDAMSASLIAKNSGVVLVSKNSDNSILKSRNTIQVGGMPFEVIIPK